MRKLLVSTLASFMVFGSITFGNGIVKANGNNVEVHENGDVITLLNDQISRSFTIRGSNILTSEINNKRINKSLIPAEGSEDFVINTISNETSGGEDVEGDIQNKPEYEYTGTKISSTDWTYTLENATGKAFDEAEVKKLFDGKLDTHVDNHRISGNPFSLTIDLKEEKSVSAMTVNKRPGYFDSEYGTNGTMGGYEIYSSTDGTTWDLVKAGEFNANDYNLHKEGNLHNVGDMVYVNFDRPIKSSHLKVVQTSVAFGTAQEFSSAEISFYSDEVRKVQKISRPTKVIDRSGWTATLKNVSEKAYAEAEVKKLFDDKLDTHVDNYRISGNPMTLDIDLGSEQQVSSLSIDKRPGFADKNYGTNGTMGEFVLYVSDDGAAWKIAGAGNFTKEAYGLHNEGNLYNVGNRVYANFNKTYNTRYVRLVQKSCAIGSAQEFSTSELNLYTDQYKGPNWNTETPIDAPKTEILSSTLTYKDYAVKDTKSGKKLTINYEPIIVGGVTYTIAYVNVLESNDHYLRSFVEISVNDKTKAQIDYIDTDCFVLPSDVEGLWSIPDQKDISSMWIGKHELMLGQPIYANGLFMGSEFPVAETDVVKNTTQIRYYSGKTFTKMEEDNQLTTDGKFVSWQNVIGAAEGIDTSVVQTAFFSYINDIATPTEFRKQYNSWYDNMMNITDDSIASSFLGAEAGLSSEGVEPLDSYVVDDGWNNYYSTNTGTTDGTKFVAPSASAGLKTPNQTGFWEFNNKFPNELYTSSSLVDKFKSTFGVWIGPQGGYNFYGGFADFLEHSGTGEAQINSALGKVVCTGSRKYIKNFEKMAIDYQERFNVEYWKWDGFASRPCNNANHNHMVGGNNNMYFTSDMWEAWVDLFDNVRENNPNLFINATCYVNLSPWLLQWVNTVWVQDSGDTGQIGTGERHEQKIYYRDNVYYQLYKQNQIQFPLKNIYNHDPIYGISDESNATTEVFREYLMANAVRGTAFWELYYSPSIFDEAKWKVTADVLDWTENNFHILENAKLFGSKASKGVYGYSSWKGNEGIISFTNPLDTQQTYTLTVNDIVGAPTSISNLKGIQVEPYQVGVLDETLSYGENVSVTLEPHETKILQFGKKDTASPKVVSVNNVDNKTIRVKFSERVNADSEYTVAKAKAVVDVESAVLLDDYRTVEIKLNKDLVNTDEAVTEVTISIAKGTDAYGNVLIDNQVTFKAYADGTIADMSKLTGLALDPSNGNEIVDIKSNQVKVSDMGVEGKGMFAVTFNIKTESSNAVIASQGDDFKISVDNDGYLSAKVGTQIISSKEAVTTVTKKATGLYNTAEYQPTQSLTTSKGVINDGDNHVITISRSANGMLKLFVDGQLSATVYDEEKTNEAISAGAVQLGSNALVATIANFKVVNHAVEYKEAVAIAQELEVDSEKVLDRTGWIATACSEMHGTTGDATAMASIDGNEGSWWHTNYSGGDIHAMGKHWLEIDFGKEITFDNFIYTGRGAGSNGSIKGYKLEAKIDGNWKLIKTGDMSEDAKTTVALDAPVSATAIRFIPTSSHNGKNFAAAVEINVSVFDHQVSKTDVKTAYDSAKLVFDSINEETYTVSSYTNYKKAFDKLVELNKLVASGADTTQFVLAKIINGVATTKNALQEDTTEVNKKDLLATIDTASKVKTGKEEYKSDNWIVFEEKLTSAIDVNADAKAKQKAVDDANRALDAAMKVLVKRIDNTELKYAVKVAESYTESNYTSQSWKAFENAMTKAKEVFANRDASANEIKEVVKLLTTAINNLEADREALKTLIKKAEGINLDGKTESSRATLITAIEDAKKAMKQEKITVKEITLAVQNLEKSMAGLTDKIKPIAPGTDNRVVNGTNTVNNRSVAGNGLLNSPTATSPVTPEVKKDELKKDTNTTTNKKPTESVNKKDTSKAEVETSSNTMLYVLLFGAVVLFAAGAALTLKKKK